MPRVMMANPYMPSEFHSLGTGAHMLLRQEDFPLEWDESKDRMAHADHDRCSMWRPDEFRAACQKWMKTGELYIGQWIQKSSQTDAIAFITDAMKADRSVNWTGFRVLGTINRSNGYPVFSLYLFAKGKDSKTEVYSGPNAPNVNKIGEGMFGYF